MRKMCSILMALVLSLIIAVPLAEQVAADSPANQPVARMESSGNSNHADFGHIAHQALVSVVDGKTVGKVMTSDWSNVFGESRGKVRGTEFDNSHTRREQNAIYGRFHLGTR